ncbi:MAG: SDR family NAD(P)-dependent oxidoreductase [Alphaproteobacteria bacterium]|nr:SDR family NAD(P)-dependent oxidoreductase [Alphaproteobacteria bacterium]
MVQSRISTRPVCVVVGAGPGNGAAFARRFAADGYAVAVLARDFDRLSTMASDIPGAQAFECDVSDSGSVDAAFTAIARDLGDVNVLIYNAGKGAWGDALSVSQADFESAWRVGAYGAFSTTRYVLPAMKKAGAGTIIFIGATASRRGSANSTAFAAAKAAQRSLAESLARAYGPDGVHVSLLIIDAVVSEPVMREKLAGYPDEFFCDPADIAETALMLTHQPSSAWTFELDIRPFGEKW